VATVRELPTAAERLSGLLTNDFCPGFNRYVYWLKEPIGWFVLATLISVIVGLYVTPVGWTMAVALSAVMLVGVAWPFIAVRSAVCGLYPEVSAVHEGDACRLFFTVRNRLPVPIWGLAVEGYLDCDEAADIPTVSLAWIPPLCTAEYPLAIQPQLRGHYPIVQPQVACGFPFGIWTARRALAASERLTVWPKVYPVAGICPLAGSSAAEDGDGQRPGGGGDPLGCRGYRQGDSPRHIHWAHSARTDTLIVTERGAPQRVSVDVIVDVAPAASIQRLGDAAVRQQLAWQMRVAASLISNLQVTHVPSRLWLGDQLVQYGATLQGRRKCFDAMAAVQPNLLAEHAANRETSAFVNSRYSQSRTSRVELRIMGEPFQPEQLRVVLSGVASGRARAVDGQLLIHCDAGLELTLNRLWREIGNVAKVA